MGSFRGQLFLSESVYTVGYAKSYARIEKNAGGGKIFRMIWISEIFTGSSKPPIQAPTGYCREPTLFQNTT